MGIDLFGVMGKLRASRCGSSNFPMLSGWAIFVLTSIFVNNIVISSFLFHLFRKIEFLGLSLVLNKILTILFILFSVLFPFGSTG